MKKAILLLMLVLISIIKSKAQYIDESYVKSFDSENNIYLLKKQLLTDGETKELKEGSVALSANINLKLKKSYTDELNTSHYKYQQIFKGVPVLNADFVIHTDANGISTVASGKLIGPLSLSIVPSISALRAIETSIANDGAIIYAWQDQTMETRLKQKTSDSKATFYPTASLVIVNVNQENAVANYKLAFKVNLTASNPYKSVDYYVDANNGSILFVRNLINQCNVKAIKSATESNHKHDEYFSAPTKSQTSLALPSNCTVSNCEAGTADLLFYGNNKAIGTSRDGNPSNPLNCMWYPSNNCTNTPIEVLDMNGNFNSFNINNSNSWGNNFQTSTTSLFCAEKAVAYFKNIHNRNSYDNLSSNVSVYLNFPGYSGNAGWDPSFSQILIGPSGAPNSCALTTLDVIGHELTHGFTQSAASLGNFGEAGALNESYADIFGLMIDFYGKQNFTSLTPDWIYGNECLASGQRNFANPILLNHPVTYGTNSPFWVNPLTGPGNGGIHTNCSVQNYMFYLLSQGGSGNNDNGQSYCVTGIGRNAAEKIAYRVVNTYLTSNETFSNSRAHWLLAASDLYGANSVQYVQVANAWYAVGVGAVNVPIITADPVSLNYCQGEKMIMSGTQSYGGIVSHFWKIEECTQSGSLVPSGATWNGPVLFSLPNSVDVLSWWPSMPCGKYYKVSLSLLNSCNPTNTTSLVFYYNCGPSINFTSSTLYRCQNDPGSLSFVVSPSAAIANVYELPSNTLIYSGYSSAISLTGPNTTNYKVVATNGSGCSVGYWTIHVSNCNRQVDYSTNEFGTGTGLWQVSGKIIDPKESDIPGFEQAWYLQELDVDEDPIYTIVNPTCWQQDLDLPVTFKGFNPTTNNYEGNVTNFNCTPHEGGILESGRTYRLTRAVKNDINPYEEFSVILTPRQSLLGDGGFDIKVDQTSPNFNMHKTKLIDINSRINESISIYPNPSHGFITLQIPDMENVSIVLYDILGTKILEKGMETRNTLIKLDISHFQKGVYLMGVYANERVYTKKIVLE